MLFALLIVKQGFSRGALLHGLFGHGDGAVFVGIAVEHGHFQSGQRRPRVAVGEGGDGVKELIGNTHLFLAEAPFVGDGSAEQSLQIFIGKSLQYKDFTAGKEGAVHLKGGILRGRADQDDAALFHKGQKRVLLRLVKAVDFIDKKDGLLTVSAVLLGFFHHLADLFDAAGHGGKADKGRLGAVGDDLRQGGFAHAGRSPEDHRGDVVALQQAAEDLAFPQQMALTDKFLQCPGTEPGRQGLMIHIVKQCGLFHGITSFLYYNGRKGRRQGEAVAFSRGILYT